MAEASDVLFKVKFPAPSRFTRGKEPLYSFYNWVLKQIGEKTLTGNKEFSVDVTQVWIDFASNEDFKKALVKWRRKEQPSHHRKHDAEEDISWMLFGNGPATWLSVGGDPGKFGCQPDWVEPGHIYVLKNWKKPPTIRIQNKGWGYEKNFINSIPVKKEEVTALIEKYGEENLRIHTT